MTNWKSYDSSVRLIAAILAAHPELKLNYSATSSHFGSDVTAGAIENRMRVIKRDVIRLRETVNDGGDCKMLKLGSLAPPGGAVVIMPDHLKYLLGQPRRGNARTKAANAAKQPVNGRKAIAEKFGEGVTPKAVSHRFERIKKEEGFDLSKSLPDSRDNDGGSSPSTPIKRRASRSAGGSAKKRGSAKKMEGTDGEEEDAGESTPTPRKLKIDIVKTGRISKSRTRKTIKAEEYEDALTDPAVDELEACDVINDARYSAMLARQLEEQSEFS